MNRDRVSLGLSAAAVVLAALACKQSGGAGTACSSDGDCKNGYLCESGVCLEAAKVERLRERSLAQEAPTATPTTPPPPPAPAASSAAAPPPIHGPEAHNARKGQRSSPPTTAEWDAVPKEIDVRHSTPLRCETKFLREWLRVSCRGEAVQDLSVIKREGIIAGEVMTYARPKSVASLVLPIRGSLEVVVAFRWTTIGARLLTVRYAAGTKIPEIYFDAPP